MLVTIWIWLGRTLLAAVIGGIIGWWATGSDHGTWGVLGQLVLLGMMLVVGLRGLALAQRVRGLFKEPNKEQS
jgi:hypothetical protein